MPTMRSSALVVCLGCCLSLTIGQGHLLAQAGPDVEVFTGEERDACEAILCLSSGERPEECTPSLRRYFSIKAKKPWKTIRKRKNFLKKCPSGSYEGRETHLSALAQGAGKCEMATLLAELNVSYPPYSKEMPAYCATLVDHAYTTAYELPIRTEHCYTDHLHELGPRPFPREEYGDAGGYDVMIVNQVELDAYDRNVRLQQHQPTPICVSRWVDPAQPVPEAELTALLGDEVNRVAATIEYVYEADD